MRSHLKFLLLILPVLMLGLFSSVKIEAFQVLPANVIQVSALQTAPQEGWKLIDKVAEAKKILATEPALNITLKDTSTKIKLKNGKYIIKKSTQVVRRQIMLAILDTETGDIITKNYWLNEEEVKKANAMRRNYQENGDNLPHFMPTEADNPLVVIVHWWNNHNSDLAINDGSSNTKRYVIIANKFLIDNESLAYPEDRTGNTYSDIIYVPYSSAIHDPTLVAAGKKFIDDHVQEAFKQLKEDATKSISFPSKLVADTITPEAVKTLFITEQTDPRGMFLSDDGGLKLSERVLVRLGANQEKTFRYTYSKTGALGLGQIMPGTYTSIVKRYPGAQLIKDVAIGRVDIVNAIKTSILVLDDHLSTVITRVNRAGSRAKSIFAAKDDSEVDLIRAAIYNGGPSKYKPLTGTISLAVSETVQFVRKFKMIRDLGLFTENI